MRYDFPGYSAYVGFCCAILMVLLPSWASAETSEEAIWITLGSDAFDSLLAEGDLVFEQGALKAHAQQSHVVLTRVYLRDLDRISALMHEQHRRCGGFIAHSTYEQGLQALSPAPAKAPSKAFEINQGALVASLKSKLDRNRIRDIIETLSTNFNNRFYTHGSGRNASVYLRNLWRGYAQSRPEVTAELREHAGWPQPSVILTIPGTTLPDEVVVLGGHLDSITAGNSDPNFLAPGADDNASGIAVLSEVIRATLVNGFRPSRTVQFMGYAAEEVGLRGSQEIANQYRQDGVNVVAVMQLDMTAYHGSSDDITLISDHTDAALNQFTGRLVDRYQPALSRTSSACGYACSDHASWNHFGFPVTFPHEARFGEGNPHIHTPGDTLTVFGNNGNHAIKFAHLAAAFMVETAFETAQPPAAPSNLSATTFSSTAVDLQWIDNSADETGFEIESRRDGGDFETAATVDADLDSDRLDGLASGTDYDFRLRAINSGGGSDYSNQASATTLGEAPPSELTATTLASDRVRLSWTDRADAETGFVVEAKIDQVSDFETVATADADAQSVVVDGLAPDTGYVFRVFAVGELGLSTSSNEATATTFVGDPEPCVTDDATLCLNRGRFKVQVTWRAGETSADARVVPGGTDDSGLLSFFQADVWEILIKVLDGCGLNDRFWVFAAATTDLQYTMTVTDAWTGRSSTYFNNAGTASPAITDTDAFETCSAVDPQF